jgi:hypothetical protein
MQVEDRVFPGGPQDAFETPARFKFTADAIKQLSPTQRR